MKRNLILILLACGAGVLLSARAQAQTPAPAVASSTNGAPSEEGDGPHHHGGGLLQRLTSKLDLSGSQQAEIAPILEAAKPQVKAIREQAKAQINAVVDSVSAKITPLLTADQQAKFAEMVEKFKNSPGPGGEHMGQHGGPEKHGAGKFGAGKFGADAQLQRLTTALGLSSEQQTQIKPILEAAQTQAKAIFANTSLTPADKVAKFKETMEAAHSQMSGILTPEQLTKLAVLKAKFHHRGNGGSEPEASPSVSGTN